MTDVSVSKQRLRMGFTLVEVLVVLVIVSMIMGMVVTTVRGVTTTARIARTKSIISTVESVIREQYDSYKYRSFPVEVLNRSTLVSGGTLGIEVLANEAARVRLIMNRDLQRMEMPDRFSDIATGPASIFAAANPVLVDTADVDTDGDTNEIIGTRADKASRIRVQVAWDSSPKRDAFFSRLPSTADLENQSAECLYMIMSTAFVAGAPAIAAIPSSNIGDTDGDGLPEILDGWGRPIGFVRWPVGFRDPEGSIDSGNLADASNPGIPDDFDLFRVDFSYVSTGAHAKDLNSTTAPPPDTHPWSFRPLIISAGGDGEFGIALDPHTAPNLPVQDYSYLNSLYNFADVTAATAVTFLGNEATGRTGAYNYPDPYLRRFLALNPSCLFPGQGLPGSDEAENRADNITNYSLQASQ